MIENSTFSLTVEDYVYTWKVKNLVEASQLTNIISWDIPDSFLEEWSWGEECIQEHVERCLKADMSFPVLVWDDKILDGCHRTIKALAVGQNKIKAKVIRDIPAPDFISSFDTDFCNDNNIKRSFREIVNLVKIKLNQ